MGISHSWKSLRQKTATVWDNTRNHLLGLVLIEGHGWLWPFVTNSWGLLYIIIFLDVKGLLTGKTQCSFTPCIQHPAVFRLICYLYSQRLRQQVERGQHWWPATERIRVCLNLLVDRGPGCRKLTVSPTVSFLLFSYVNLRHLFMHQMFMGYLFTLKVLLSSTRYP